MNYKLFRDSELFRRPPLVAVLVILVFNWLLMASIMTLFPSWFEKIREDVVLIGQKKIDDDIQEIYKLLAANGATQRINMGYQARLFHYIAGHQSSSDGPWTGLFCPECGLIEQLEIRRAEINDEVAELSEFIQEHPNDPSIPDKIKTLEELDKESMEATRRIFHSHQRAKEIGPLMKIK